MASGQVKIYCEYNHQGKWRFPTKVICGQSSWNPGKQIVRTPRGKGVTKFDTDLVITQNSQLDQLRTKLFRLGQSIYAKGEEPTPDRVKLLYMGDGKKLTFWPGFEHYMKTVVVPPDHTIHSTKKYKSTFNFLRKYEKFTRKPITFESLGKTWARGFRQYLRDVHGNVEDTQTGKIVKLKAYLEYAHQEGWHKNEAFRTWKSAFSPGSAEIVLSIEELIVLARMELDQTWDRIRDIALAFSMTGLRYEASQGLTLDNLHDDRYLFKNKKGGKDQSLPIARVPLSIIAKHEGFPRYANQPLNRMLKELCRKAGIDKEEIKNGKTGPKYSFVTCHTFRKSFTSILMKASVDFALREHLVGHSLNGAAAHYHNFEHEHLLSEIERAFKPLTEVYLG